MVNNIINDALKQIDLILQCLSIAIVMITEDAIACKKLKVTVFDFVSSLVPYFIIPFTV